MRRAVLRRIPFQGAAFGVLMAIGVVLTWMAVWLALRAGLFGFSVGRPPTTSELTTFTTFIGGGLATAATMFGGLLTAEHNARERRRLQFETIVKSLEAIPAGPQRAAGAMSTAVLMGQPRVALRMLEPAWKGGTVDDGTATWIIDMVLTGAVSEQPLDPDGECVDDSTVIEAAYLLLEHAGDSEHPLTDPTCPGKYEFPGRLEEHWSLMPLRSNLAKMIILQAMAEVLLSQRKDWWCGDGRIKGFPLDPWGECAVMVEENKGVRDTAAALFLAAFDCFPRAEKEHYLSKRPGVRQLAEKSYREFENDDVDTDCFELAQRLSRTWATDPDMGPKTGDGRALSVPSASGTALRGVMADD